MVILVLSLRTSVSNAQEIIDTPTEETIIEVPVDEVPLPESSLEEQAVLNDTVEEAPVELITPPVVSLPIDTTYDDKRLEIMAFQLLSFESTGEYTQVKEAQVVEGDVIGFDASMVDVVESTDEIHVYDAPCGKGWQLIIYEDLIFRELSTTTKMFEDRVERIVRSYGYGCEHDMRTINW